jgi:hypothetical protein
MMSPEQQRKKSEAMEESQRHARYAQADGSMKSAHSRDYEVSPAIEASERRVKAATAKEDASIGGENASINDNRY